MSSFPKRDAISRSRFFLGQAQNCPGDRRDEFEAYLEAAIIFARAALHRLQSQYHSHVEWKSWWNALLYDDTVKFIRDERNWILKEAPPKINQIIRLGGPTPLRAGTLYYYDAGIPADITIEKYIDRIEEIVREAEARFSA
jgi:hypothetical protein